MTDSQRWFALVMVVILLGVIYKLGPILIPFTLAFLLAYMLNPLVTRLQSWHVPRSIGAFFVFFASIVFLLSVIFSLVPDLEKQIATFSHRVPLMFQWLQKTVIPWINTRFGIHITLNHHLIRNSLFRHFHEDGNHSASVLWHALFSSGATILEILTNIIMIPVVTLYLLIDWQKVTQQGKYFIPLRRKKREVFIRLMRECGDMLAGFFRGQLLVIVALAIFYCSGLSFVGLDLALLIGVVSGLLSIIPYLGFFIGLLLSLAAVIIQFHDVWHMMNVLLVFGLGSLCENFIFSPWFVGDRIGLHPVAVIFAVLVGGKLFGLLGVLLALPVAAIIMVFLRYIQSKYFNHVEEAIQES